MSLESCAEMSYLTLIMQQWMLCHHNSQRTKKRFQPIWVLITLLQGPPPLEQELWKLVKKILQDQRLPQWDQYLNNRAGRRPHLNQDRVCPDQRPMQQQKRDLQAPRKEQSLIQLMEVCLRLSPSSLLLSNPTMTNRLFQGPRSLALLSQDQEQAPHHPWGGQPPLPDMHQGTAGLGHRRQGRAAIQTSSQQHSQDNSTTMYKKTATPAHSLINNSSLNNWSKQCVKWPVCHAIFDNSPFHS